MFFRPMTLLSGLLHYYESLCTS